MLDHESRFQDIEKRLDQLEERQAAMDQKWDIAIKKLDQILAALAVAKEPK